MNNFGWEIDKVKCKMAFMLNDTYIFEIGKEYRLNEFKPYGNKIWVRYIWVDKQGYKTEENYEFVREKTKSPLDMWFHDFFHTVKQTKRINKIKEIIK